ncbi:MAG: DUF2333 family protein [Acidiferrobacterales bacterium]|nr:DUF2333 family protein [Acidiferrobacterales bacterium]
METLKKPIAIVVSIILLIMCVIAWYWSREPDFMTLDVAEEPIVGVATTEMLIKSVDMLLQKPGGYLSNDKMPPSVFLDNMPNWEFGVLQQVRDLAKALRNDLSRSQSQSLADEDLEQAEPKFNVDSYAWLFPSAEGEYKDGKELLQLYLNKLKDTSQQNAQFYARADNLNEWLSLVEKRLGSLSQRLSAARPQLRINTDLAGDKNAEQSTETDSQVVAKTSWFEIDNNFYEARGTAWALIHFMRAAEIDFKEVLEDKNALVSLQQIIRELESTQQPIRSLIILNGSGMGMFANHSLVMSSYITRANAAIADLRSLLADG